MKKGLKSIIGSLVLAGSLGFTALSSTGCTSSSTSSSNSSQSAELETYNTIAIISNGLDSGEMSSEEAVVGLEDIVKNELPKFTDEELIAFVEDETFRLKGYSEFASEDEFSDFFLEFAGVYDSLMEPGETPNWESTRPSKDDIKEEIESMKESNGPDTGDEVQELCSKCRQSFPFSQLHEVDLDGNCHYVCDSCVKEMK